MNSIRARLELIMSLIETESPDVLALQETKCTDAAFPAKAFEALGFESVHVGDGPRAGVCVLSRRGLADTQLGFGGSATAPFDEPRLVAATVNNLRIVAVYAPNGKRVGTPEWKMKLAWFELLRIELELELDACRTVGRELLVVGDFNVCPTLDDVYDPIAKRARNLVSLPERDALSRVIDLGFIDLARQQHGADAGYTWFSYRPGQFENDRGYRLDLALATPKIASDASCVALRSWRDPSTWDRPSDHLPLCVDID